MKRVEVEWLDSLGDSSWRSRESVEQGATYDALVHTTVGYLVCESDHSITLAMGRSLEDKDSRLELLHDTMQIPRVAILDVRPLRAG